MRLAEVIEKAFAGREMPMKVTIRIAPFRTTRILKTYYGFLAGIGVKLRGTIGKYMMLH